MIKKQNYLKHAIVLFLLLLLMQPGSLRHEIGGFGSLYFPRVARRLSRCARKNWSFLFA